MTPDDPLPVPSKWSWMRIYLICALPAVASSVLYVLNEHPAYLWDWGGYWKAYADYGQTSLESPARWLSRVFESVRGDDYNPSGVVPLTPVYWIFGGGRAFYVAAIIAVYLVPAALIAARLAQTSLGDLAPLRPLAMFAALVFPVFWNAALRGMIDVAGLIPLGLATLLALRTSFLSRATLKEAIWFGLLLWATFLLRRWYAFAIVALILSSSAAAVLVILTNRRPVVTELRRTILRYSVAGIFFVLALIIFQGDLARRILQTSYSDAYSAYQSDAASQISLYAGYFGYLALGLVALGLLVDLMQRRMTSLFMFLTAVLTALLFSRVQAPSLQHLLPVGLFLFPGFYSGLAFIHDRLGPARPVLWLLLALNFISTYLPDRWDVAGQARVLFPRIHTPPLYLENFAEYQRLIADLKALDPEKKVAVFASSPILSDSLLAVLSPDLEHRIELVSQVDSRDGFRWTSLMADYFVVAQPTPLHLNPPDQRVIQYPADEISQGTGIGAAMSALPESYALAGGVTARIYARVRPLALQDISPLADRFLAAYPDWRGPSDGDLGALLGTSAQPGDVEGAEPSAR